MDGVVRFQWWCPLCRKHQRFNSSAEHKHMCRHEPSRVDFSRRHVLRKAIGDRSRSGNDDGARVHYARSRVGTILGGYSDGNCFWKYSMGVHDGSSQKVFPITKGKVPSTLFQFWLFILFSA